MQVRDRHNQELQEQVQTKDREITTHRHHFQQQQEEKNSQIQHLQNTIQTLTTQMEVGRPDLFSLSIHIVLSCLQELRTDLQRRLQTKDADISRLTEELSKCQPLLQEKEGQVIFIRCLRIIIILLFNRYHLSSHSSSVGGVVLTCLLRWRAMSSQ